MPIGQINGHKLRRSGGLKNALSFNEPDLNWLVSSNILPADAATAYKTYVDPLKSSLNIGMPSVLWPNVNSYSSGGNYNSRVWAKYFLGNCSSCHFDHAAIHYYADCAPADGGNSVAYFQSEITDAYNTLGYPLWITEFECKGTEQQQISFMQATLPWLDAQKFVFRYAWFGAFPELLINAAGTGLSALGNAYATT
jgi:hypothetical protein